MIIITRSPARGNITDIVVQENQKLELSELEGNILNGKTLIINAAGLVNNSGLRDARDGYTYFGNLKSKNNVIINDFILNMPNSIWVTVPTAFKIYFDVNTKNYYFAPGSQNNDGDSIIFVKLEKKMVKLSK